MAETTFVLARSAPEAVTVIKFVDVSVAMLVVVHEDEDEVATLPNVFAASESAGSGLTV